MDADVFEEIPSGYYFNQILKLIIFCYEQIKNDKIQKPYRRKEILEIIKEIRKKENVQFELEDYLRNDLVNNYISKKNLEIFKLNTFQVHPGVEVSKRNVTIGRVDIQFTSSSATSKEDFSFIFECKRLNKIKAKRRKYIEKGMMRFIEKQYYAESNTSLAGMIAFIEIDTTKHKKGIVPVDEIVKQLKEIMREYKFQLKTTQELTFYPLLDKECNEISNFKYSYQTKHVRAEDEIEIDIHHLLLDYNDILIS